MGHRNNFFESFFGFGYPFEPLFNSSILREDVNDEYTRYDDNGALHSLTGPARRSKKAGDEYFIHGEKLSKADWEKKLEEIRNAQPHYLVLDNKTYRVNGDTYKAIKKLLE